MSFLWRNIRHRDDDQSCSSSSDAIIESNDHLDYDERNVTSVLVVSNDEGELSTAGNFPLVTWEQAHRQVCYRNASLKVSMQQIESQFAIGQEIPKPDPMIVWEEPTIVNKLAALLNPNHESRYQTKASNASLLWRTFQGLWTFAGTTGHHDDNNSDDDDESSIEEDNDKEETQNKDRIQRNLVHPQLAFSVLDYLQSIIQANLHEIIPLSQSSSWKSWVIEQRKAPEQEFLSCLPKEELKVLIQALERTGVPVFLHTSPLHDLVLVTGTSEDVSVRLVQYDLSQTAKRLEQEYATLEEQSSKYRKAALTAKQRKGNPIPAMKLYKLCETQMTHKQNHLLQIETVRMTLQQAVNNRSIVQAMGSARTILRDLHKDVDNVHEVMDNWKDVMQDHEEVNAVFHSIANQDIDEDELFQELQNLSLESQMDEKWNGNEESDQTNKQPTKEKSFRETIEEKHQGVNSDEAIERSMNLDEQSTGLVLS